jgi:cytochrome c553
VRLGAGHFHGGCAPCHGAPGEPNNPIVQHMLPSPPKLSREVTTWTPKELFWIVKNGLKYTGMPAWTAHGRDDEVWAMVAFLNRLPTMDAAQYRALALGNADQPSTPPARELTRVGSGTTPLTVCARCHGAESAAPTSRLVPKLAGQSARYLQLSLQEYAAGLRPSGIMQPIAAELDANATGDLAKYYANLSLGPEASRTTTAPPDQVARGQRIATTGVAAGGIPPCVACHVSGSAAIFPRLAGQHAPYTAGQLRLWRKGLRNLTARGAIMAAIARRLSEQQIDDVAAYFANLSPGGDGPVSRNDAGRGTTRSSP